MDAKFLVASHISETRTLKDTSQKAVELAKNKGVKRDLAEEIDFLDIVLTSLVVLRIV